MIRTTSQITSSGRRLLGGVHVRWSMMAAFELLLYLALAFLLIYPVTLHLTEWSLGTGDGEFYLWLGWRLAELIREGSLPIMVPDVVYPEGYNVSLGDGYGAYLLIALWNLVVGPFAAINMTVVSALFLNFLAGRRLGRIVAPQKRVVWIVTAVAFGTAPPILLRAYGHFHLIFAFVSALTIAEAVLYLRDGRPIRILRVALLLACAFLFSIYWLASTAVAFAVMVIVGAIPRHEFARAVGRVAATIGLALVILTPFIVQRAVFDHRERAAAGPGSAQEIDNETNSIRYSADALSVIAQPSGSKYALPLSGRLHRNFFPNRLESTIYPGALLLLALLVFAFLRNPYRWPVLSAVTALWVLALGPTLQLDGRAVFRDDAGEPIRFMPMEWLYHFPGTASLRTPSRLAFALPALCAVALAVVASRVLPRVRRGWQVGLIVSACAVLVVTNLVILPYTPRELTPGLQAALERMRANARPGDTVAEVPFDAGGKYLSSIKYQMTHRLPVLGFHAQASALPWYSGFDRYKASEALAEIRCFPPLVGYAPAPFDPELRPTGREFDELKRDFHVRYLIVNDVWLADASCNTRRTEIESILSSARTVGRGTGWQVLDIDP